MWMEAALLRFEVRHSGDRLEPLEEHLLCEVQPSCAEDHAGQRAADLGFAAREKSDFLQWQRVDDSGWSAGVTAIGQSREWQDAREL